LLNDARRLMGLEGKDASHTFFMGGTQMGEAAGAAPGRNVWPTTEAFDYAKQAIDDRIGPAIRQGNNNLVRLYTQLKGRLDKAIANANPDAANIWQQARQAWANPTAVMNARELGQGLFNPSTRRDELANMMRDFSQPEMAAFTQGARDALAEMMDRSVRGDTNVRNLLLSPTGRDKMLMLAPTPRTNQLFQQLDQEVAFAQNTRDMIRNSQTAARQAMGQVTQPQPGSTAIAQLRNIDISKPLSFGTSGLQRMAEGRQAAQYEAARDALAGMLMQRGPGAQSMFAALGRPRPGEQGASFVDRYLTAAGLQAPTIYGGLAGYLP